MDKAKVISQIRALLARADSPFEEEARTSLYIAHKKMREHGLGYEDLGMPGSTTVLSEDQVLDLQAAGIREYLQCIGSAGGRARAENMSPEALSAIGHAGVAARMKKVPAARRREIARQAANARWQRKQEQ